MSRRSRREFRAGRTRRRRSAVALGCLLVLASAACSGGSGPTPGPDDQGQGDPGPIVVASGLDVTGSGGVRQQLIKEWNEHHADDPALQAKLVELPGGADQQRSQLLGALQSGSAGYDVVNLDITWVPEFAEAGLIRPLSDEDVVDSDVIAEIRRTSVWKGRSYARPFNSDVGLLYYRPDRLTAAGITLARQPTANWTWADLGASIDTLSASRSESGVEAGWTTQLDAYEGLTVNTIEAFESVGVHLADEKGHYTAGEKSLKKGLEEVRRRARKDRILDHAFSSDEPTSLADFAQGRIAFVRHWPYVFGALQNLLPPEDYSVNRLPGASVLGGQNLAVTTDSPRAAGARKLIDFLTSPESERCLLDAGFAATRASAYDGTAPPCYPRVAEALHSAGSSPSASPGGEGGSWAQPVMMRTTYTFTLSQALQHAVQRPRTPYYGAFTQVLQSHVHAWLTSDGADADEAAAGLDAALREAFSGH
ncbi:extracellular solute-binding protein [Streptomyces sp. NBC_00873]|uniref:extracellular solute-binding protein n=1 Tax=unclassified Streptomyces TaxID=2593676 RepID=UPI0038680B66|nr:extracellular solute-binding protein [Streptomyces sp. NBC_00873]WTA43987.1 extracellular solute-binding protein [Streptomyces sp. NBC_00842]